MKKPIILGYNFKCGCFVEKKNLESVYRKSKNGNWIRLLLCIKHNSRLDNVVHECADCHKSFTAPTTAKVRCSKCSALHQKAKSQEYYLHRKEIKKQKKLALADGDEASPDPAPAPKKKIIIRDNQSGAVCRHRGECLNKLLFQGEDMLCDGCTRFEPMDASKCMSQLSGKICLNEALLKVAYED